MNDTSCRPMYTLRPVVKLSEKIDFPKCMYSMKNIQTSEGIGLGLIHSQAAPLDNHLGDRRIVSVVEQKPHPAMEELEIRQEAILKQLTQLKDTVLKIKASLSQQPSPQPTNQGHVTAHVNKNVKNALTGHDIVINASPKHPPYALLALSHLWRDSLAFTFSWHTHSNVVQVPNEVKDFMQANLNKTTNEDVPRVTILIVWKDVGVDTELVVSPMSRISVRGEVNILRYLSRLGPSQYNYEAGNDHVMATKVDAALDICHCLAWSRTVKDRQALLRALNTKLGKSRYLTGDSVTIADAAAWSVLHTFSTTNLLKDLTVTMSKWFHCCSGMFSSNSL